MLEQSNSKLKRQDWQTIPFCGFLSLNDKHFKETAGIVSLRRIIKLKQRYRMQDQSIHKHCISCQCLQLQDKEKLLHKSLNVLVKIGLERYFPTIFYFESCQKKHHKSLVLIICTAEMCMALHYAILHYNIKYENQKPFVINSIFTDCT